MTTPLLNVAAVVNEPTPSLTEKMPDISSAVEPTDERAALGERDAVAVDDPQHDDQREDHEHLHQDRQHVLRADEAAVEQREAGDRHHDHQQRRHDHPRVVALVRRWRGRCGRRIGSCSVLLCRCDHLRRRNQYLDPASFLVVRTAVSARRGLHEDDRAVRQAGGDQHALHRQGAVLRKGCVGRRIAGVSSTTPSNESAPSAVASATTPAAPAPGVSGLDARPPTPVVSRAKRRQQRCRWRWSRCSPASARSPRRC